MGYETNKQKLKNYFFNVIYPLIDTYGINYRAVIVSISQELSLNKKIVEEFITELIESGKLKEIRMLELPQSEIDKRRELKKEIDKEVLNL